jgi:phosphoglycolate phosphatase
VEDNTLEVSQDHIKAVLFDLDGTLVDTLEDLAAAVNHMLTSMKRLPLEVTAVRHLIGGGARNLVQRALNSDSVEDVELGLNLLLEYNKLNIAVKSKLYPGARELLEKLASQGKIMAIISNKNESLCRILLETLEVEQYFSIICGGDTFPELKPSPSPLLYVVKHLGLTPDQTVMVGDSINDIAAGNRARITTIGCKWGFGEAEELIDATYRVSSCGELGELIDKLELE